MSGSQASIPLRYDSTSVRVARENVRYLLGDSFGPSSMSDVELVTSELVTNAVVHGGPPVELRVRQGPDEVVIEVCDGSPSPPRSRTASPESPDGRGLLIVERLSSAWGIDLRSRGKCVWASFDRGGS